MLAEKWKLGSAKSTFVHDFISVHRRVRKQPGVLSRLQPKPFAVIPGPGHTVAAL